MLGLAIYFDVTGEAGRYLTSGLGALVGLLRMLVPLGLIGAGVFLIAGGRDARRAAADDAGTRIPVDRPDELLAARGPRLAVGSALVGVAVAGLLHVAGGDPAWSEGVDAMADAGGLLGFLVGSPLAAAFTPWGAAPLLLAVGLLGLVVLTGTSGGDVIDLRGDGQGAGPACPAAAVLDAGTRDRRRRGRHGGRPDRARRPGGQ